MNIVIPMAGEGRRFKEAGYNEYKPFIDVLGKPMIERVVETLPEWNQLIFIIREEHLEKMANYPGIKIPVKKTTEGAACTVLLAKEYINNSDELLIVNSDQIVRYNINNFNVIRNRSPEGIVFVFKAEGNLWSFVKFNSSYEIEEVAEKTPISEWGTCGIYYWKQGSNFVKAAEEMIRNNHRVNGEFYVAPVYNNLAKSICPFFVDEMIGLGTPEDLENYLVTHSA